MSPKYMVYLWPRSHIHHVWVTSIRETHISLALNDQPFSSQRPFWDTCKIDPKMTLNLQGQRNTIYSTNFAKCPNFFAWGVVLKWNPRIERSVPANVSSCNFFLRAEIRPGHMSWICIYLTLLKSCGKFAYARRKFASLCSLFFARPQRGGTWAETHPPPGHLLETFCFSRLD